jgi:hypothetical protein
LLHPVPREVDKNLLAFAPVSVGGAAEVLESVHRTSDAWIRMVNTLDDLADVLSDIDEGRF